MGKKKADNDWLCQKCGQIRTGTPVLVEAESAVGKMLACHGNVCQQCLTPPPAKCQSISVPLTDVPPPARTLEVRWHKPKYALVTVRDFGDRVRDYLVTYHSHIMCELEQLDPKCRTTYTVWVGRQNECGCCEDGGCDHVAIAKALKAQGKWYA